MDIKEQESVEVVDIPTHLTQGMQHKHVLYAIEWFKTDNMTQSAVAAGYSSKSAPTQGRRLSKRDDVQAIAQWLGERAIQEVGLEASWVIDNLRQVVLSGMTELPIRGPGGVETGGTRMADAPSAVRALELLGRYKSMWQGDAQVDVKQQVAVLGGSATEPEEWGRMVERYLGGNGKGAEAPDG